MPKTRLTDASVKRFKAPDSGRIEYFDELLPGFGLRISAKGRKSWIVFYRVKGGADHGKQVRYTLPASADAMPLGEAREAARAILRRVERGENPANDKIIEAKARATAKTVREAADQFIERYAKPRNKSWGETARILDRHVCNEWADRPIGDIARADVIDLLDRIADRAPVMANRTLAALRRMFAWHVERGTITLSPATGVSAPARERERERVLSDDEIAWFWQATGEASYPFGNLYRLLLATAQRRDEVAKAAWTEFNLDAATWTIPRERTKGDRAHEVPLSAIAIEILNNLPRIGPLLFSTSTDGARHVQGFSHSKARIAASMDTMAQQTGAMIAPWRLHDLRRTAGTGMASAGVPVSTISRVLNHTEGGVTKIYNRFSYADEKRDALDRWGRRLGSMIGQEAGVVIALHRDAR